MNRALTHASQEGQEFEAVPGSQFSVARTAHRSNQSDYYINDRKAPPKDVTEKLKGHGIDLDNNRFLILQVREDSGDILAVKWKLYGQWSKIQLDSSYF